MPRMLYLLSSEKAELREYRDDPVGEGMVLARTEYASAKHGTEIQYVTGQETARGTFDEEWKLFRRSAREGHFEPGGETGNMFVGVVLETGKGVERLKPGDRVLGHGAFRETQSLPAQECLKMPEGLSWKSAVCLDPAEFALAAARDGDVGLGDAVAIFGMGAIGLMTVQMCRLSGARPIIALDPLANRRKAAEACGADIVLDPASSDAGLEIRKATDKRGADIVIEFSGSAQALQAALRGVAFGGSVVVGAFPAPYPAGLDFGAEAHMNRPNVIFCRACSDPNRRHPRWSEKRIADTCWRMIREGKIDGEKIVTPVVPFEDLVAEYPKIISRPQDNIKLGVAFERPERERT